MLIYKYLTSFSRATFSNHDSSIFMRLRTLLRQETQEYVINSFGKQGSHNLLVIECQSKTQRKANEVGQLYGRLSTALNNSNKKIILIAEGGDALADKFNIPNENKIEDQTSFKDLDPKSQDKVLERKVNFQGKEISLNQLIDKNSAGGIIDQGSLSRLLEEEKIPIGDQKAFSSIGYVPDYYIKRKFHRQRIKTEVLKDKAGSELFFITGANNENLTGLGVENKDIHTWRDRKKYKNGIILPSSGESDQEIFKDLVKSHPGKSIHWLEYQDGRLVWRASKGNSSALEEYIDKNDVLDGKNILREEDFSKPEALGQKVIIIANDPGVGKSTVLTSIAHKMKQENPALWVVRVNLNDYAVDGKQPQSLHNIKFQEDETEKAIEFVSKMAVPSADDDPNTKFQRKFFKSGLEKPKDAGGQKPKIVILFDGFDEISPNYKPNATKLIKALKGSKVIQLWATTRVHEKAHLEKELESPAYILNPLTEEEQKNFLSRFWKWNLKFYKDSYNQEVNERTYEGILEHLREIKLPDEFFTTQLTEDISNILKDYPLEAVDKLEELREAIDELDFSYYAWGLLDQWNKSISDRDKEFTFVPLHLRMLTEVVFEKKFQLPKDLGLFDLYDEFIKIKFDIYHREKAKTIQGNQAADATFKRDLKTLRRVHHELALKLFFPKEESLPSLDKMVEFTNDSREEGKKAEEELARVGLLALKGGQLEFIHRSFAEYFLSEYLVRNLQNEQVQKLLLEKILIEKDYELIRKFFNGQLEKSPTSIKLTEAGKKSIAKDLEKSYHKETLLHLMANEGHCGIYEFLFKSIQGNAELLEELMTKTYNQGLTTLHLAIWGDHYKIVKQLLYNGLKLDPETFKKKILKLESGEGTPLSLAAHRGYNNIVTLVLNFVKDHLGKEFLREFVLETDIQGETALHVATKESHTETVKTLLNFLKENFNNEDPPDTTLKELVLKANKHNWQDETKTQTALHKAAKKGYIEIVNEILDSIRKYPETLKELVLKTDYYGATALLETVNKDERYSFLADEDGKREIVSALLQDINDPEVLKDLAILSVYGDARKDPKEIVAKLLSSVENNSKIHKKLTSIQNRLGEVNAKSKSLSEAISLRDKDKVQEILNESQAYLKELVLENGGQNGRTVLIEAADNNQNEIVEKLLESVKNYPRILEELVLKVDTSEQETALHRAARHDYHQTVLNLLIFVKDHLGKESLKKALLIESKHTGTAIHAAHYRERYQTVKVILEFVEEHLPEILEKQVEEIGGMQKTLELAEKQGYSDLKQRLLDRTGSQGQRKLALFKAAEDGDSTALEALLDGVKNDVQALKELLAASKNDGETLLDLTIDNTTYTLLNWVKENLKEDLSHTTLKKLVLASGEGKVGDTNFLNWVKENLEETYPGTLKKLLMKAFFQGKTALSSGFFGGGIQIHSALELLDWVKNNTDEETLNDLVLAIDYDGRTALHSAVFDPEFYYKSKAVIDLLEALKDHPKILKELVLKSDISGETVLHKVAKETHYEKNQENLNSDWVQKTEKEGEPMVRALLKSVKDDAKTLKDLILATTDRDGKTALDLAVRNNNYIANLLKAQYDEIASSLLKDDTNIADFSNEQLKLLQKHVESYDYIKENKQEILRKLKGIHSERSQNIGLRGGSPSDATEAPGVLRLRGGSSLEERYMEGYNLSKGLLEEMHRLLEAGAIEKGELPVLVDMEESSPGEWQVPLINKESLDQAPRYLTTEQEIFSQVKDYLQEQAKNISPYYNEDLRSLSFREEVPGEAVDGLNSSFLAQAVFNWVRHGFGPELGEGMPEDLSKILKAQFYVQVSMMGHGALSDVKNVVENVKLLMREETLAGETLNGFEHSMLSSAGSALGLGLGGGMVILDALELSKLKDPSARAIVTTQLVFDSVNLGVGAGALISGIVASKAAAGSALAEVAATSSASLGYLAVPLAGIGIGVTALVQAGGQGIEQAKGVCRMLSALKKELAEGYVYDKVMQAFMPPSLAGVKKLTLSEKEISFVFAQQRYHRFRSGWHNRELIPEGPQAYGSFLKSFGLKSALEQEKPDDQGSSTLVMPYIPSKDYDFSLGAAPFSYFRHDAEFAVAEELERKDPGFHFKVFFFDHIIKSYRENCKDTDVEVVVKEGSWQLLFPWVYDKPSEGAQERKAYIKRNAEHITYKIQAEEAAKEITLGLPPLEFPLNLSLSQEGMAQVKWCFELSHLEKDVSAHLEGDLLQIGSFKVRLSKISKEQLFFRRRLEESLENGRLTSNSLKWREVEIIAEDEDLQALKEKLHTQISLHKGHEDYLRVETRAKDQVTYYDVGRNRYIKTPLSFQEGGKSFYAREALLLNVEGEHAYFYAPWDEHPLGDKAQERLPLLFCGVTIDTGKILYPERITFSRSEELSKWIEIAQGENFALSTKLYSAMGATFIEERYESKVSQEKEVKLLWQLAKREKAGDLDLYLHAIEGVSKALSMESFTHLSDQIMIKDDQGKVRWWLKKEKQFVNAMPASSEGAYPVPLKMGKNTKGESVCFWLLHQKENLYDLIYAVKGKEKNKLKNIKFVSQVDERLILESQEGIIYEVDNDFKRVVIGLDEGFIREKKPSEIKEFLKDKKDCAPVLSLRGLRDALSKPLMCWYEVRADRYYMSSYEGHPNLSYKGASKEGLGLIYDQDQKALYTLEGIREKDLDGHYKVAPQGGVILDRVSKQDKIISGINSVLSDGKSLQIEDSEGCLWVCDLKRSFKKWQLRGLSQEMLKGSIESSSIHEKTQKAQEALSSGQGLELEIPAFVSLGALGFYVPGAKKLILLPLQGQEVKEVEVLGVDGDYGYVNIKDKLYQIPLKDYWQQHSAWPEKKVLGEGKIQRLRNTLILLEGSLSEEALEHLRELKGIKDFYINTHHRRAQELWLYSGMASEVKERAPVILSLMDALPEGIVRIHLDENASEVYKVFREASDLVIGYGMEKRELILKGAFEASSRAKVGFYLPGKGSIRKLLSLDRMVACIREELDSLESSQIKTIQLRELFRICGNEIMRR